MATMTQSARIPGPSWDETIVPALRKRLESESRTLAKRMSAVSISSLDEGPSAAPATTLDSRDNRNAFTPGKGYDSRPMTNHTLADGQPRYHTGSSFDRDMQNSANAASSSTSSTQSSHPQRSRTYSQSYASDQSKNRRVNGNGPASRINGTKSPTPPDSSRTVSPAFSTKNADLKPTRIPQPRVRTASASSHQLPHQHRGVNGYNHASTPSSDLYPVHETRPPPTARSDTSSIAVPSRQGSGLLNEAPPFTTSSITSKTYHPVYGMSADSVDRDPSPSRMSSESEERPFEHWYRGEVSRNGGVGELRVAKRMEMLEIANYGHTIKQKVDPVATLRGDPNRIVGIGIDATVNGDGRRDRPRRRKRADSVSGILGDGRESLYLDDERAREVARVLDEHPPTDLDDDGMYNDDGGSDTETEDIIAQYDRDDDFGNISTMTAPMPSTNHRSTTPINFSRPISRTQNHPSRIPTPSGTRKSTESSTPHSPPLQRGASEPLSISTTALPTASSSQNRPTPTSSTSHQGKTRAKSPASAKKPPSASARTRAKALAAKQQREEEDSRRSVAYYPTPSGDESLLKDAIPTWTQPKPKTGNWDEVVLPVVARKKGLDDHYEQADGSPRAKQEDPVAPAPGTFGYDHSKYRPPRGEDISMDEFGRPPVEEDEKEEKSTDADKVKPSEPTRVRPLRRNLETPPPFSHYLPANDMSGSAANVKPSQPIPSQPSHAQLEKEEEGGAGCCKCVIM